MKNKAISPMIATVLLIAFTVAVGGIVSLWLSSISQTEESEPQSVHYYFDCDAKNIRYYYENERVYNLTDIQPPIDYMAVLETYSADILLNNDEFENIISGTVYCSSQHLMDAMHQEAYRMKEQLEDKSYDTNTTVSTISSFAEFDTGDIHYYCITSDGDMKFFTQYSYDIDIIYDIICEAIE